MFVLLVFMWTVFSSSKYCFKKKNSLLNRKFNIEISIMHDLERNSKLDQAICFDDIMDNVPRLYTARPIITPFHVGIF